MANPEIPGPAPEYRKILDRGIKNHARYTAFLKRMKKKRGIDADGLFQEAHEAAFNEIDCRRCGLCCTELGPRVTPRDADRMARRTGEKNFVETHLHQDEDGDWVFKSMPCPFFGFDGDCIIYADRPAACRNYPHLDERGQRGLILRHSRDLKHCPAVVLAVEHVISREPGGLSLS